MAGKAYILPSAVIAQASVENALGTSELAQNADALFGNKYAITKQTEKSLNLWLE